MSVRANLLFLLSAGAGLSGLSGCATISSPQGGPRDLTPPKLISTSPPNGARNVKQQFIRLEFSEPVQLKELSKNLLVAPVMADNKYEIREERTAFTLRFEKPLDPNTTYSFNFRDAVVDITESNKAAKVALAFSTGARLDSGSVRGRVSDLLSSQPADGVSVLLYPEADTLNVRRGKPYYLAKTEKDGAYALQNLKAGRYRIYALADKNQNGRYDDGERIGYLPELLSVRPGLDSVGLALVRPDARRPLIISQQPSPTQFRITFNEGLRQAVLAPLGAAQAAAANLNDGLVITEKGRIVQLVQTPALQAGRYVLATTDSVGNTGRDTINVRFQGLAPTRRPAAYTVEGSPRTVYRQGLVTFQFAEPLRPLVAGRPVGTLVEDSLRRSPLRTPQQVTLSPDRTQLVVSLATKARKTVSIILDSTAIVGSTGRRLGLKPLRLAVTEESPFGSLAGTVQTRYKRYQLQLVDATYQPIAVLDSPKGTFRFNNLTPGTYRLRVLIDADGDGTWRGGDPKLLLPAEPVYVAPQTVQIRANWEVADVKLVF
ncbi:Ig-like domain-containing protein [Hymenobacter daecheongensis DSM 21074]|uniref:Ig-like domain-containing protein n=1 Tax=Hymenobacter daecheongensis DSM 21074 TaxID=1121955 RepID=A0A1M6BBP9_9BACT|nr:Ig-like domain-containing protein [Hymenobacter daecheongensis]SHI45998.1 Ig-like domain-containing protein [Hymenobacter daecheongensis DSM 21074]